MHVDQVGYLSGYSKAAMVTDSGEGEFYLVDVKTGQTVYQGQLSAPKYDAMSEETLRRADFSDFNAAGTYVLKVGGRTSPEFAIGDNVYAVPAVQTLRSYTLSRCGSPIDDDITGLKVKMGHPQDKEAQVYFTDKLNKKGDKVDVTGGWYDAGDHGKYVVICNSVFNMCMDQIEQICYLIILTVPFSRCRYYDHLAGAVRFYNFLYLGEL